MDVLVVVVEAVVLLVDDEVEDDDGVEFVEGGGTAGVSVLGSLGLAQVRL